MFNEVRDVRNAVLSHLQAQHDPNDGMHFGNEGTVHHAGGSMRMSEDHSGVVDKDLRLEGYDNLYVCDVSVYTHDSGCQPQPDTGRSGVALGRPTRVNTSVNTISCSKPWAVPNHKLIRAIKRFKP
jgi:hypothetical protein